MTETMEYKCPACSGVVAFDSTSQMLKCPYCDTTFDIEAMLAHDDEIAAPSEKPNWENITSSQWGADEEEAMSVYACQSCGGEIVADTATGATSCPYCGNNVLIAGKFSGNLRPDYIIPFKLDKKAAKEAFSNYVKGKRLIPKIFRDQKHIDEIKGLYVPFWLFDCEAEAEIDYRAEKKRNWHDSTTNYTETSVYRICRSGRVAFERIAVDGSSKMDDELMESIEPYDWADAVDFQTAYLAGYLADKYDVGVDESLDRAHTRVKESTEDALAASVDGYSNIVAEKTDIKLENGTVSYALYPVWMLNTAWEGQQYTFAMNGQTGKFVGDLPLDKGAYRKWQFGLGALLGAAIYGLMWLIILL